MTSMGAKIDCTDLLFMRWPSSDVIAPATETERRLLIARKRCRLCGTDNSLLVIRQLLLRCMGSAFSIFSQSQLEVRSQCCAQQTDVAQSRVRVSAAERLGPPSLPLPGLADMWDCETFAACAQADLCFHHVMLVVHDQKQWGRSCGAEGSLLVIDGG